MIKPKSEKVEEPVKDEEKIVETTDETVVVDQNQIDETIRKHVYAAMALGLAPLPLVDVIGLTAIQLDLARALAAKYNIPFKGNRVKSTLVSLLGSVLPIGAVPVFASLVKFIPFVGTTTGAASMSLMGGASTYAIGQVFDKHFASGGDFLSLSKEKVQEGFKQQYEKGKEFVSGIKKSEVDDKTAAASGATTA